MENQISEEIAIDELQAFVKHFTRKTVDADLILTRYPDVIEAITQGALILDKESPSLNLLEKILTSEGDTFLSTITFKTRFLPSDQRKMANGVDMKKDQLLYAHKCLAFIIGQPLAMLDKLSPVDYKVSEQLSTLFM